MASHRYWRIYIYSTVMVEAPEIGQSAWREPAILEMEFRESIGGPDVTGAGTAFASVMDSTNYIPAYAFDDNENTAWRTPLESGSSASWLAYDFGEGLAKDIVEFFIKTEGAWWSPYNFELQYSDDAVEWFTKYLIVDEGEAAWQSSNFARTYHDNNFDLHSPQARRFWRVRAWNDNQRPYIAEIELKESLGGVDVTGSGTAIASEEVLRGFVFGKGERAFDNDYGTYWVQGFRYYPAWVQYDFGVGETHAINTWTIRRAPFSFTMPRKLMLLMSADGVEWYPVSVSPFLTYDSGTALYTFNTDDQIADPPEHRYWRLYISSTVLDAPIAVSEMQFRDYEGGVDLTGSGTAIASSEDAGGGFVAQNAFDNVEATKWAAAANASADEWIGYDFGAGQEVEIGCFIVQVPIGTSGPEVVLQDFKLQYSDDGEIWITKVNVVGKTDWAESGQETVTESTEDVPAPDPIYPLEEDELESFIIGNFSDLDLAAPSGADNIKWQINRETTPPNISAYVPRATTSQYGTVLKAANAATFLIGIGAPITAGNNVAPPYRVKQAGTIQEVRARAKAALEDDVELMLRRIRQTSPPSDDDILSANLTIGAGSTAWEIATTFADDDLEVDDELELDVLSGNPENVTLEVIWN